MVKYSVVIFGIQFIIMILLKSRNFLSGDKLEISNEVTQMSTLESGFSGRSFKWNGFFCNEKRNAQK